MSKRINPYRLFVGAFIPNWLLRRKEVSPGAKLLYARLSQYAGEDGQCHPAQSTLAEELGLAPRTIKAQLKELEDHRLIESHQRGLNMTNLYYFLSHEWMQSFRDEPAKSALPEVHESALPEVPKDALHEVPGMAYKENHRRESLKRVTGAGVANTVSEDHFGEFWKSYPKRVGKGAALKSWNRIKPGEDLFKRIMAAVSLQSKTPQWTKDEGRFIPNPATWLNQMRWEDDVGPVNVHHQSGRSGSNVQDILRQEREAMQRKITTPIAA